MALDQEEEEFQLFTMEDMGLESTVDPEPTAPPGDEEFPVFTAEDVGLGPAPEEDERDEEFPTFSQEDLAPQPQPTGGGRYDEIIARMAMQDVINAPGVTSEQKARIYEQALRKYGGKRGEGQVEDVARYRPEPEVVGGGGPIDKLVDAIDTGLMVIPPLIGKSIKSVARVPAAYGSGNADVRALRQNTPQERRNFLSRVHKDDSAYEDFSELVDGMNKADAAIARIKAIADKNGYSFQVQDQSPLALDGGDWSKPPVVTVQKDKDYFKKTEGKPFVIGPPGWKRIDTELPDKHREEILKLNEQVREHYEDVGSAANGLTLEYLLPFTTRSPYGGESPRPWAGPTDVTENVLRGWIGKSDSEDLLATRKSIQTASGYVGDLLWPMDRALYNFGRGEWLTTSRLGDAKVEILKERYGDKAPPISMLWTLGPEGIDVAQEARERVRKDREDRINKGDLHTGLFAFEFLALAGPDLALPKTARVLITPAGRLTEGGDKTVRAIHEAHTNRLASHFDEINTKRIEDGLEPISRRAMEEEGRKLARDINGEVARLGDEAAAEGKVITGFDFSDAVHLTDDGVSVIPAAKPVYAAETGVAAFAKNVAARERQLGKSLSRDEIFASIPAGEKGVFANSPGGITGVVDSGKTLVARIKVATTPGEKVVKVTPEIRASLKNQFDIYGDYVVQTAGGGYRPLRFYDTIAQHKRVHFQKLMEQHSVDLATLSRQINDASYAVKQGTATAKQRELYAVAMEYLGNPSAEAAEGISLLESLNAATKEGLEVVPVVVGKGEKAAEEALASIQRSEEHTSELQSQ